MTGLQIAMIVIGMVCLIGSFFVSEKLSKADLEEMKKMSEQEIKVILDARMQDASAQIDEKIQDKVEDAVAQIERGGEKETNEKILAISEYSDTVLTSMNKSHDEIVFLYDMTLDDKLQVTGVSMDAEAETLEKEMASQEEKQTSLEDAFRSQVVTEDEKEQTTEPKKNAQILSMYKEGMSEVEIAKQLGRGLGEVKLVLGLFGEEQAHEV